MKVSLPVAIAASGAPCLAAADDFWVGDDAGRITHSCSGSEPLVMCMQGRKVVMQVRVDKVKGFIYTARFFNVQRDPLSLKRVVFEAGGESMPGVQVDGRPLKSDVPLSVTFDGLLTLIYPESGGVVATRRVYPSTTRALVVDEWQLLNTSGKRVEVAVAPARSVKPVEDDLAIVRSVQGLEPVVVEPGGMVSFSTWVQAGLAADPDLPVEVAAERGARQALAEAAWHGPGRLETPDPALDLAYALQKFHVLECPIETCRGVITHNGSLTYSPGIWANDPVEYSSPVFPFFGDPALNRAGMDMYRVWQDYILEKGLDPFPGSFEGPALKLTQRERGDDAMVLYGLSKFLLFQGDRAAAEELWPLIEFSAASVLGHTSAEGIIVSQTDEMEDRYPTGKANLSTSALAYGGYCQAARLAQALGKPVAAEFDRRAETLRKAIESYFGAEIEGFKTYRYYKENTTLRGWILLPLAMGITERQDGTVEALLSDKLWPKRMEGADILAESTRPTEWGRETYYALRVLFKAGRTEEALDLTRRVVKTQIFGKKGPYPDEDAIDMLCPGSLYPRVFTEGLFGIVPTGLDSFTCTPWLPKDWPRMALRDLRAFGRAWDLVVERDGAQQKVSVRSGGQTVMTGTGPAGKTYPVSFAMLDDRDNVPELKTTLMLEGAEAIQEPYPVLHGGAFDGPVVKESPDPLVAYRWKDPKASDGLQIYFLKPVTADTDKPDAFDHLASATTEKTGITVKSAGSIRLDFGVESGAWVEFDSPDCPGDVEMSISEYNEPGLHKSRAPVQHGNTWRLELNRELYDGMRFAWIHVKSPEKPWHITDIRAVCQVKPTNYAGSFSCSDPLLTKIWYMSAYGVKASLCKDYFGAILMDRGDRMSWTGDAHTTQAAALVAFGNFDFIKKNIDNTSGQDNGIRSYALYWVFSLLDYFSYTGDTATLEGYIDNACAKLDGAYAVFGKDPALRFYGWDERLCAGFELWFKPAPEAQKAYKMLSIRAWNDFGRVMGELGRTDLRDRYLGYAREKMAELRKRDGWSADFGLHAAADAINTGALSKAEQEQLFEKHFLDRVNRLSISPFNQYFILHAMARVGKHDEALSSIRDMWGGMLKNGATTTYEVFRPSWNGFLAPNDRVPSSQSGLTSLCHPWGAGVVKWLNEEVLGIVPTQPGFKTYDILPHPGRTLTRVSGETPTPHGTIRATFDFASGRCSVSAPEGTVGRIGIPKLEKTIASITINGKLAWDGSAHAVPGIGGADQEEAFVVFTGVQPGTYDLAVEYRGETPVYDEPALDYAAETLEPDTATGGNWGGVYGKEGHVLCNYNGEGRDEKTLPSYVTSLEYYRAFPKSGVPDPLAWEEGTSDQRALARNMRNGPKRNAMGYSNNGETMTVTIGIDGPRNYQVALYFVDWEKQGSRQAVEMMDADTQQLIAPVQMVSGHAGGMYLVYRYDRSVKFRINKIRADVVTLSGIFFDPETSTSMIKDYGLKDYVRVSKDLPHSEPEPWKLVCTMPYNGHFQPSLEVEAPAGKEIRFNSTNPLVLFLTPTETVTTEAGTRNYEARHWVSGEGAMYTIPAGVTVKAVKYRETGYDTTFAGSFECNDNDYNVLWNKAARTAYICMREQFYDCPDRERVGFWGDGTPELNQCFYVFDSNSHQLAKELVRRKLEPKFYPGQHLEFLGEYGLWFYYLHTGDLESIRAVYDTTRTFLFETYAVGNPKTWFDWGIEIKDTAVIETCFYYMDLRALRNMALVTGHEADLEAIDRKLESIKSSFDRTYWKGAYYMSSQVTTPDDRANAMAVNAGLADPSKWPSIYEQVLTQTFNASNFFDRWVFDALCTMGKQEYALLRMYERFKTMIPCRFTTLWEGYDRWWASVTNAFEEGSSLNHGWNPPAIILSQRIAGITPVEAGWATYEVKPREAFLTAIKVVVPSIKGDVTVDLKKTASAYALGLTSPADTTAIVGIPKGSFTNLKAIEVNGAPIWNGSFRGGVDGIDWHGEDADYVMFKAAPGTWKFVGLGSLPMTSPKPLPAAPSDDLALDKKAWIASASVEDGSFLFSGAKIPVDCSAAHALDGDPWTGWRDMTKTQYAGQWFQVDMKREQRFDKIVLDNTWALWDSPDRYAVTVSDDGVSWGSPIATGAGALGITTITFPPQCARFLRITQTGTNPTYHWSIYELDVYLKNQAVYA